MTEIKTQLLEGKTVSRSVLDNVARAAGAFRDRTGRSPGLAVIHAGADPASEVYVKNKEKACEDTGVRFMRVNLPVDVTMDTLLNEIDGLNADPACDGLIVQLPLPSPELDEDRVIRRIAVSKDIDGFHPETIGCLWSGTGKIAPCTPAGIMVLLDHYAIPLEGRRAVIVGRSNIVGKPLAALLLRRHATVTIAHSRTRDLADLCRTADVLIAAVGRPGLIREHFIQPGATVIDVGINRVTAETADPRWLDPETPVGARLARRGRTLVGDVDPLDVMGRAGAYTPVPGGVGPMTVAMLLQNTMILAEHRAGMQSPAEQQ
ncbi:MAG TPA: bifunctional 5,10-methylenetetrahydrofolate dehydrogenase/5,10-methenyltetrahydrofolate cyclohydrolase [bacterium]|nr:bifunctional 5,10-methylenetetrahydrofolate dehydrogenase/5,10-methenyltetrahydrofolate cyclohydrolase [bacterium]